MTAPHVLVVDDDKELCELLSLRLESRGFTSTIVHDARAALEGAVRRGELRSALSRAAREHALRSRAGGVHGSDL